MKPKHTNPSTQNKNLRDDTTNMFTECNCNPGSIEGHPSVHIPNNAGGACIDEELIPIVRWLWTHKLETVYSCQDDQGRATIVFTNGADVETALLLLRNLALDSNLTELAVRMGGHVYKPDELWHVKVWTRASFWSNGDFADEPGICPGVLYYQLSWPTADTNTVTSLITQ